jgi:hypothetical protein
MLQYVSNACSTVQFVNAARLVPYLRDNYWGTVVFFDNYFKTVSKHVFVWVSENLK